MASKPPTMGALIDGIWALREKKRQHEADIKKLEEDIHEKEDELLARMDKEGIDKSTGKHATVSVSNTVVATIKDWDKFIAYVQKKKYFHLLQRRVSDTGCRELFEQGKSIDGLEPFNKRKLNVRSLTQ